MRLIELEQRLKRLREMGATDETAIVLLEPDGLRHAKYVGISSYKLNRLTGDKDDAPCIWIDHKV